MTLYEAQPGLIPIIGYTADRPTVPPDRQALFWDIETGLMYAVNISMQWVVINPPFPEKTSMESFTGNFTFATTPSGVLMTTGTNTLITEIIVDVQTEFTAGATAIIGDLADTDRLFPSAQMNLQEAGLYRSHPLYTYSVPTDIEVRVSAGASDGFAAVYIIYDIDSQN